MMRHIALLGGAFNPITKAHIETALFVLDKLKPIDEVWITPVYCHTFNKDMVDAKHRIAMCKLAITDKRIKLFDYEIKNKVKDGTLNLCKLLKDDKKFKGLDFTWIIGMDNANNIEKWVNCEELIKTARFIVVNRHGVERDISKDWYTKYPHVFLNRIHNITEISSTQVRTLLSDYYKTNSIDTIMELRKYMDHSVLNYIIKHKLYLENEKTNRILQQEIAANTKFFQSSK